MSLYLYELPTTGAISFSDFCTDSAERLYTNHISDTTQARANLRAALKESKRTHDGEKDYLKLVKILEEYLPRLRGILACVASGQIQLKSEPIFSWRTTLSANLFNTSPRLSLPSLDADYAYSLLTYAFALSNLARAKISSLGTYEHDRAISDADRKAKDSQLTVAADLLCRTSGIFSYISETVLGDWESTSSVASSAFTKPPDLSREVNSALAKSSLADAQTLAIRKLLSKAAYDSNVTPGPPLPKSHPSPALISKLHLECASLYSSARTLAKTPSSAGKGKPKGTSVDGEVSADLRRYLHDETVFHDALARKWLGVDAGENGGTDRGGDAVGFLIWAKKELEELKGRKKDRVSDELETVNVFLKHYKKVNDSLHFQPVPTQADLQSRIPTGRLALSAKTYVPPQPAFGPGSLEDIRRKAEELEVNDDDSVEDMNKTQGSYAGAGSYF
ncbi:BRO1 domain-containing protein [Mycena albidolilacea]|uniref:pH-response regulator protein palC n=1 Tax=Mycena albidolilacea TaxID=1033008 RepID=A0AAD7F5H1_9AGAR|nr:BRO1 domain-containing protein [Mycena albidolilacea]